MNKVSLKTGEVLLQNELPVSGDQERMNERRLRQGRQSVGNALDQRLELLLVESDCVCRLRLPSIIFGDGWRVGVPDITRQPRKESYCLVVPPRRKDQSLADRRPE